MIRLENARTTGMKETKNSQQVDSADLSSRETVRMESLDTLFRMWKDKGNLLDWNCIFMLPHWLQAWWGVFGKNLKLQICSVWDEEKLTGIAPLVIDNTAAHIAGNSDLSDYVDLITVPGKEYQFMKTLFAHLRQEGISSLYAADLRGDSSLLSVLKKYADKLDCTIDYEPSKQIHELQLPRSWDEYLKLLSGVERHEVRRKFRRLEEAGNISHHIVEKKDELPEAINTFIALFRKNLPVKAEFMSDTMESFFRSLAESLARDGLLKLSILLIDKIPAAATFCFSYRSAVYLYNNGYDRQFSHLSVSILSKILSIRHSIDQGETTYDFLKGDEPYKRRLGGKPVQLYRCSVTLN